MTVPFSWPQNNSGAEIVPHDPVNLLRGQVKLIVLRANLLSMPIYALGELVPDIDPTAFIHPDAVIIGNVRIGPESSVWPGAVLRADYGSITIGAQTSIQDGTVIHCTLEEPTTIGDRCTIGHNVHIEGAHIHDDCLIGSGSIVLNGSTIGPRALIGAGALVPMRKVVPAQARAVGVPCVITENAVDGVPNEDGTQGYVANGKRYLADLRRLS